MITIATWITLFRIVLVVPIIFFLKQEQFVAAGVVLAVAGLTDLLDGYIARRYAQQSTLGALLDPLADKILMLASFTTFWVFHAPEPLGNGWELTFFVALIWVKELLLALGAFIIFFSGAQPVAARFSGKLAMFFQTVYGLLLFFTRYTKIKIPSYMPWAVTVVTLFALCDYAKIGYRLLRK
jgi:cardiolipin synthase